MQKGPSRYNVLNYERSATPGFSHRPYRIMRRCALCLGFVPALAVFFAEDHLVPRIWRNDLHFWMLLAMAASMVTAVVITLFECRNEKRCMTEQARDGSEPKNHFKRVHPTRTTTEIVVDEGWIAGTPGLKRAAGAAPHPEQPEEKTE